MKKILMLLLMIYIISLVGCSSADKPMPMSTYEFSDPVAGFSISFPGEPTTDVKLANGKDLHIYNYVDEETKSDFSVLYEEIPELYNVSDEQRSLFFSLISSAVEGSELVSDTNKSTEGYLAREVVYKGEYDGNMRINHLRTYLVGNRLYQVVDSYQEGVKAHPLAADFTDSFTLLYEG